MRIGVALLATASIVASSAVAVDARPAAETALETPGHRTAVAEPLSASRLLSLPGQRSLLRAQPLEVFVRERCHETRMRLVVDRLAGSIARTFVHCGTRDRRAARGRSNEPPA